jgi:beta-xylosidase
MKLKDHTLFEYADDYYLVTTQITLPLQTERDEYTFGYARTRDFCTWEHLSPALVAAGDEVEQYIWAPHVIEEDGTFYMFYTSVNANIAQQIALATSTNPADPESWQKHGIVFQPQHDGMVYDGPHTWSDARDPMVLRHDQQYWLYYTGRDSTGGIVGVAVADTLEGPWRDQGAVLRTAEGVMPESPFVIKHAGRFYLSYTAAEPGSASVSHWQWATAPSGPWHPARQEPLGWAHDFSFTGNWWLASYVIGPGRAIGISPVRWNTTAGTPPVPQIGWSLFLPLVQRQGEASALSDDGA